MKFNLIKLKCANVPKKKVGMKKELLLVFNKKYMLVKKVQERV